MKNANPKDKMKGFYGDNVAAFSAIFEQKENWRLYEQIETGFGVCS